MAALNNTHIACGILKELSSPNEDIEIIYNTFKNNLLAILGIEKTLDRIRKA